MQDDLAPRLRDLRDRRGWTTADMAERTGIPKRTLDKYMLRQGASRPGFDALMALSRGLGVSLDWLVFGAEFVSEGSELLAARAAELVARQYFEGLLKHHFEGKRAIIEGDEILGLSPEDWALDLGMQAGEMARDLASQGVTREELLEWRHSTRERALERAMDRASRLRAVATNS